MKKIALLLAFLVVLTSCSSDDSSANDNNDDNPVLGFTPCTNGLAGQYPCDGFDLLARLSLSEMNAGSGNDIWGWTDPNGGKEYALVGLDNGTAFVDITDTENLVYLGKLPTQTTTSTWRDIKVFQDHAFIGSEAGGHGMQVFDLTQLRNLASPPVTFDADAVYDDFGSSHNIVINENTGFAYPVGARNDAYNGGVHFVDISDPKNPVAAGGYGASGYTQMRLLLSSLMLPISPIPH